MDYQTPPTLKAKLVSLTDNSEVPVHFNPTSLVYTVENSTKQTSGGPKRKQFAAQFSGKLSMDLQFDTTGTGEDVRVTTNKVAAFMQSSADAARNQSGASAQAQPVVSFQWGSYEFKGTMESFKETIDFFSADGVPLRSLVSIGLARQDQVFDAGGSMASSQISGSMVPTPDGASATSVSTQGGDPTAARQLGSDNGLDSLRFTGGASLQVNAGIQFNAAAGFAASASVSAGLSIGGGAGITAGISAGVSGGVSFGASAGVSSAASLQISAGLGGGALFGGQASAGVPATSGAFVGLETGRATLSTTARLNPLKMLSATTGADVSTGVNASYSLGGAATSSTGFTSDVGAQMSFSDRLVFDNDNNG
jgi:hypothetical protein